MKIEITDQRYSPELLRAFPEKIFVFGDNIKRYGKGGQATIRNEPNAYGIATKRYPSKDDWAYFSDRPDEFNCVVRDLRGLYRWSKTHTIVFPVGGIGTGMAQMEKRSPFLFAEMNGILEEYFGFINGGRGEQDTKC